MSDLDPHVEQIRLVLELLEDSKPRLLQLTESMSTIASLLAGLIPTDGPDSMGDYLGRLLLGTTDEIESLLESIKNARYEYAVFYRRFFNDDD